MTSSPYHRLFRHGVKYLAQRYYGDEVDSEDDDGALVSAGTAIMRKTVIHSANNIAINPPQTVHFPLSFV